LWHRNTVPKLLFGSHRSVAPTKPTSSDGKPPVPSIRTFSKCISASVTVLEFVSQDVDLKPVRSLAIRLCPFHNDHNPSFGVNDAENCWSCFAGCGEGSVTDFWRKWRKCDPKTAVKELAKMVLWQPVVCVLNLCYYGRAGWM
jgi:hypothetical protein